MLNRIVIEEFLDEQLEDTDIIIPKDIEANLLIETFSKYVEYDYYEWLRDNFKSFFNHGNPDWDWIRNRIKHYSNH